MSGITIAFPDQKSGRERQIVVRLALEAGKTLSTLDYNLYFTHIIYYTTLLVGFQGTAEPAADPSETLPSSRLPYQEQDEQQDLLET